jgi:serine phosphatase RsbU (regulator of sigma subunit)
MQQLKRWAEDISRDLTLATRVQQSLAPQPLCWGSGGHPPALLISPSGELRQLESCGTVLGVLEDTVPRNDGEELKLSVGDRLMLYSDGLLEVWNCEDEMLGLKGVQESRP